jgi:tRNA (guanine-N7-)-methyltransferase
MPENNITPLNDPKYLRTIKSFVLRDGRMTKGQSQAIESLYAKYSFDFLSDGQLLSLSKSFKNDHPVILEIGFGSGESLLNNAMDFPLFNFIGIDVFRSGAGQLLSNTEKARLTNVRVVIEDAVHTLTNHLANESLDGIQILFPDPWPKKKHHKRRLINKSFLELIATKLKPNGMLYIATDHHHYADWINEQIIGNKLYTLNSSNNIEQPFYSRSSTRFERRGLALGHQISEWRLQKNTS